MNSLQQCLRPPLRIVRSRSAAATAFYRRINNIAKVLEGTQAYANYDTPKAADASRTRTEALLTSGRDLYPRFPPNAAVKTMQHKAFRVAFDHLTPGQTVADTDLYLQGRVMSIRISGSGLAFVDLAENGQFVQGICVQSTLTGPDSSQSQFRHFLRQIRRGDIYSIKGKPHRTKRGQLSIMATELPRMLSPCLHPLPTQLQDPETRIRHRHVDLQVNPRAADTLRLRSTVIAHIRRFLESRGYLEVQTPILANSAGGAVARPFSTSAIEFPDRHIELRTAPELWLKRLVLGGFERIFELGPCFRNEGLDTIHNPEFTTCEFYAAYKNLDELMIITEQLLIRLAQATDDLMQGPLKSLQHCGINFATRFRHLEFIQEIESAMNLKLPDLTHQDAEAEVTKIFQQRDIRLPESPTLPRLLDRLSAKYLEPLCQDPTWIIHHPECLAPLSKSFVDPATQQRVSARAELFINGKELVNTYEEENSPFEQRRKFEEQVKYRGDADRTDIDENYLQALEWGLPPTGGWGCGIDRLIMMLSRADRISDVLPFGNLRNVVSLGRIRRGTDSNSSGPC